MNNFRQLANEEQDYLPSIIKMTGNNGPLCMTGNILLKSYERILCQRPKLPTLQHSLENTYQAITLALVMKGEKPPFLDSFATATMFAFEGIDLDFSPMVRYQ